jgi:hypothetical protein
MVVCAGYLREFPVPAVTFWRRRSTRRASCRLAAAERDDKTQRDAGDRLSQYWLCHQAVLVAPAQIGGPSMRSFEIPEGGRSTLPGHPHASRLAPILDHRHQAQ